MVQIITQVALVAAFLSTCVYSMPINLGPGPVNLPTVHPVESSVAYSDLAARDPSFLGHLWKDIKKAGGAPKRREAEFSDLMARDPSFLGHLWKDIKKSRRRSQKTRS